MWSPERHIPTQKIPKCPPGIVVACVAGRLELMGQVRAGRVRETRAPVLSCAIISGAEVSAHRAMRVSYTLHVTEKNS